MERTLGNGICIDSNVMASFAQSFLPMRLTETKVAQAKQLIERIRENFGFAIDAGDKIKQQWLNTCGSKPGTPFVEWYYQSLKEGKIKFVVAKVPENHKRRLRVDLGFPNDQFELTYIGVANATMERYIVTEDMHFYEPSHKAADEAAKMRSRGLRQGSVCRYLRHEMRITVGTIQHAIEDLWPPTKSRDADGLIEDPFDF